MQYKHIKVVYVYHRFNRNPDHSNIAIVIKVRKAKVYHPHRNDRRASRWNWASMASLSRDAAVGSRLRVFRVRGVSSNLVWGEGHV